VERESHSARNLAGACECVATKVSSMRERRITEPMRTEAADTGANSDALLMTPNDLLSGAREGVCKPMPLQANQPR